MTFLIQPLADLMVPLYRIARNNPPSQRKEETEKFIQAACKTGFAATICFVEVLAQNAINKHAGPSLSTDLIGRLLGPTVIYGVVCNMHAYVGLLSRALYYSFVGMRANKPAETKTFYQYLDIAAIVFSLYVASKLKIHSSSSKLDQRIVHLSKNLASYIFEPTR